MKTGRHHKVQTLCFIYIQNYVAIQINTDPPLKIIKINIYSAYGKTCPQNFSTSEGFFYILYSVFYTTSKCTNGLVDLTMVAEAFTNITSGNMSL